MKKKPKQQSKYQQAISKVAKAAKKAFRRGPAERQSILQRAKQGNFDPKWHGGDELFRLMDAGMPLPFIEVANRSWDYLSTGTKRDLAREILRRREILRDASNDYDRMLDYCDWLSKMPEKQQKLRKEWAEHQRQQGKAKQPVPPPFVS